MDSKLFFTGQFVKSKNGKITSEFQLKGKIHLSTTQVLICILQ